MKILIIEDDIVFAEGVKRILNDEGFTVDVINDGEKGLRRLIVHRDSYDIVILDLNLPGIDGDEVCKKLREEKILTPVIVLSGQSSVEEKVKVLNMGADDYITKPFFSSELIARLQALLRRPKELNNNELTIADIKLNPQTRAVHKNGKEVNLTLKEFSVLEYLMRHPNQVVARDQILDHAWDFNFSSFSNVIDVHINGIRKKMNMKKNDVLETVRGVGYRLKSILKDPNSSPRMTNTTKHET